MRDAKQHAASSTSAWLLHLMWLAGLRERDQASDADIALALADAETGKPLTVSTFKEEMGTVKAALESAERDAEQKDRHARKREMLFFVTGWLSACSVSPFPSSDRSRSVIRKLKIDPVSPSAVPSQQLPSGSSPPPSTRDRCRGAPIPVGTHSIRGLYADVEDILVAATRRLQNAA